MTDPQSPPPGSAPRVRPELLTALLAELRSGEPSPAIPAVAPLVTRIVHPALRRPVAAPVLRTVEGARAARPVLVPADLAGIARPRRTADPNPGAR